MKLLWSRYWLVVALLLVPSCFCKAQTPGTGAVTGMVVDPSGRSIDGADVTAISDATQMTRSVKTAGGGVFHVPLLPPEPIRLPSMHQDFRKPFFRWM